MADAKKDKTENDNNRIFKGPEQVFQHGKASTWYEIDNSGNPLRLAISIDSTAMASLDRNAPTGDGHHHENMVSLKFHPKITIHQLLLLLLFLS